MINKCITNLQRTTGKLDILFEENNLINLFQSGSSKIFIPKTEFKTIEPVIVNTAGGITDNDQFDHNFSVNNSSHVTFSTQAAEKIYKSYSQGFGQVRININVSSESSFHWIPQETIIFNESRFKRNVNVFIEENCSFLSCEIFVLGRKAMKEILNDCFLLDHWKIYRNKKLIHFEALKIYEPLNIISSKAGLGNNHIIANILYFSDNIFDKLNEIKKITKENGTTILSSSSWQNKVVFRILGNSIIDVRNLVMQLTEVLRNIPPPKMWA